MTDPQTQHTEARHTGERSGDWYCPSCERYLVASRVTHDETCDTCHTPVVWHDAGVTQDRIDACVNACKHIKGDPGEVIQRAIEAIEGARRSVGGGGFLNCWCDSEWCRSQGAYPHQAPPVHTKYCDDLRAALSDLKGGSK